MHTTDKISMPQVTAHAPPVPEPSATRPPVGLSRRISAVGAAMLVLVWIAAAVFLVIERGTALDRRARENVSLAAALTESTLRVLKATDQAMLRLSAAVQAGTVMPEQLAQYASETGLAPDILVQLSLVGADGRFVGSNLDPYAERTGHVDLSGREHVRAHLAPRAVADQARNLYAQGLFVGKPVLGKVSGRWTVQLSRRIPDPSGGAMGVIVASLDPAYFETVYRSISLGAKGTVALVGTDLTFRARVIGGRPEGMGSAATPGGPMASAIIGGRLRGTLLTVSSVDAIQRVTAFERVGDYPLYVLINSSVDEVLAEWRSLAWLVVTLMALLTLGMVGALFALGQSARRLEATNRDLSESQARAMAANQAKTEFLAAVSHELRTPLTSIRGFAELMETRLEQPRLRDAAGIIRRSAEHLNGLLTDILDFAKVEAGKMQVRSEPVAVRELLQGAIDTFRITAADKGLALDLSVDERVPETVAGDEMRLKQVLNNLLSNALKFTKAGGVTVSAERQADRLLIHVNDTGPGIAPELQELVFERFRQADASVANEHGGTGLGLALSRGLVELMGGTLTLQSEPGHGSRFSIALPLDAAA